MMVPVLGSSHSRISSSGLLPPAIAQAFQAPADVPTIMSNWKRSRSTFHTPTSQAAYIPPAERTNARLTHSMVQAGTDSGGQRSLTVAARKLPECVRAIGAVASRARQQAITNQREASAPSRSRLVTYPNAFAR